MFYLRLSLLFISMVVVGCNQSDQFVSDITNLKGGDYIQLVYIGSSGCGFCSDSLHHEIKKMKLKLREWANNHNYRFISTGISVDVYSRDGIQFLNESGPYDEIIAGGSWYNLGAQQLIWNEKEGEGYTPQINILRVKFNIAASPNGNILNIDREQVLLKSMHKLHDLQNFNKSFSPFDSTLTNYIDFN